MGLDNLTLPDILSLKANALSAITRTVARLPPEKAGTRPSPEEWSVAENLEHLVLVETQTVRLVESLVAKIEQLGQTRDAAGRTVLSVRALHDRSLTEQYKTRDRYEPSGTVSPTSSLEQLQEFQAQLFGLEPRLRLIDLGAASFTHWVFGPLTLGQWLAFIALHEERHLGQMQSVLTSPALR